MICFCFCCYWRLSFFSLFFFLFLAICEVGDRLTSRLACIGDEEEEEEDDEREGGRK